MSQRIRILFEPMGKMVEAAPGETILDAANRSNVVIRSDCSGVLTCGKCRVVLKGARGIAEASGGELKLLSATELALGYRLACAAELLPVSGIITVMVPDGGVRRARKFSEAGVERHVRLDPLIQAQNSTFPLFGLAVDIGTSRVTARLVDLRSGLTLGTGSVENPQMMYGENLMTRAAYAQRSDENRLRLRAMTLDEINKLLDKLTSQLGFASGDVSQAVVVGNTVMHHLFLGLDTKPLTRAPFTPTVKDMIQMGGAESGLNINPSGIVTLLPNVDAFVGADAISDILSSNILHRAEPVLLLDIGTNTELVLRTGGETLSCSCASGPAFEGEHIENGMKAVEGAIEAVKIRAHGQVIEFKTLGLGKPVGICGSGIVDALAEMLREGLINRVGRFNADTPQLTNAGGAKKFVLARGDETETERPITVSERDINEVILAKAAIHAAAQVLMGIKGIRVDDLRGVLVAGAFGNHLNKTNAKRIELLPTVENRRITFIGNAALSGATMAIKSRRILESSIRIARETRYVELAGRADFESEFKKSLLLPSAK